MNNDDIRWDKHEEELLNKIKDSAESVPIPESLTPEAIEAWLPTKGKPKKRSSLLRGLSAIVAAAVVCLFCGVAYSMLNKNLNSGTNSKSASDNISTMAVIEADTESAVEITQPASDAAENKSDTVISTADLTDGVSERVVLDSVDSYETLFSTLNDRFGYDNTSSVEERGILDLFISKDMAEAPLAGSADGEMVQETAVAEDTGGTGTDYSDTNVQVEGIDEGDIVKTDGSYIYILKEQKLYIVSAKDFTISSVTDMAENRTVSSVQEMYLDGDILTVIADTFISQMTEDEDGVYRSGTKSAVMLLTYDISDRTNPALKGELTQDGSYRTSRKSGDYLYLFTNYYPAVYNTADEIETYVPAVNGMAVGYQDIYIPGTVMYESMLVISSVDITKPDTAVDSKTLVSAANNVHISSESIYLANETYISGTNVTELMKFHYEDGKITAVGAASVKGYLNNDFSLNEDNGYLRIVSTYYDNTELNALYILDEDMKLTGKIEDLAPGETIRSARFMGDTGYFVTFRQMDPLFSVDLSDPYNPQILGELKITGFSQYLHFYTNDLLLGLGLEVDADTGEQKGLKLSMFDISNPANVTEENKSVLTKLWTSTGLYNYKAVIINEEKNLIGFTATDDNYNSIYLVYSYNEQEGFVKELSYTTSTHDENEPSYYVNEDDRGLFIGDTFYIYANGELAAFDLSNGYQEAGVLELK